MNNTSANRSRQPFQICDFYIKVETDFVDIFTVVINLAFAVSAILGNALVLIAIRRTTALWLPTKILLCSLAFADLGVGLIAQPFFALKILLEDGLPRCIVGVVFDFVSGHLSIASFMTMMVISIDKCMAAQLKLRYRIVVTEIRSILIVGSIWTLAIPWAISFFVSLQAYCMLVLTVIPVCFSVSFIAFAKIRLVLHRQRTRLHYSAYVNPAHQASSPVNIARYRSSVRSMLYLYCAQVIAYFPAWLVMLVRVATGDTTAAIRQATQLTLTFIFINSTVNPAVYLWRIKELREAASEVIPCSLKPMRVEDRPQTPSEERIEHSRTKTFTEFIGPA